MQRDTARLIEALGIDSGGPLMDQRLHGELFFSDRYLGVPLVPGAVPTIARLAEERFGDRVYIVTTNVRRRAEALAIFAAGGLTQVIPPERVFFCDADAQKAEVCDRLGITHFVDDRTEVLALLERVPHRYLFGAAEADASGRERGPDQVEAVRGWDDLARLLLDRAGTG